MHSSSQINTHERDIWLISFQIQLSYHSRTYTITRNREMQQMGCTSWKRGLFAWPKQMRWVSLRLFYYSVVICLLINGQKDSCERKWVREAMQKCHWTRYFRHFDWLTFSHSVAHSTKQPFLLSCPNRFPFLSQSYSRRRPLNTVTQTTH